MSSQPSPSRLCRVTWFLSPLWASFTPYCLAYQLTSGRHFWLFSSSHSHLAPHVCRLFLRPVSTLHFYLPSSSHSQRLLVTFVWLLLLAGTGIFNITKFSGIFRAFDPSRAVMCNYWALGAFSKLIDFFSDFVRTKRYDTLSGVLLAITGCEALFAK